MTRIATMAQNSLMVANLIDMQSRIADTQISISSGLKGQDYSDIAPDARRLVSLETNQVQVTQYVAGNNIAGQRLQTMATSVDQIMKIAQDLRTQLIGAVNASGTDQGAVATQAQIKLNQVANLLNTQSDGRYLFGGAIIDRPPVDLSDPGFTPPSTTYPSTANTSYYHGDSTKLSVQADESVSVTYGVTADEPAFEKILRALNLTGTAGSGNDFDVARGNEALKLVNQAISDVSGIVGRIGSVQSSLDSINSKHDDYLQYLNQSISDIKATDIPTAMTKLSQDTTALQASYSVVARMATLSLTQYLK